MEKNFVCPVPGEIEGLNLPSAYNKFSYVRNGVDDIIEKVLEGGGDVEFVDEGMLSEYGHIALIQYY